MLERVLRHARGVGLALVAVPALAAGHAAQLAPGRSLSQQAATPACALCHTLRDAGSEGAVGPVPDELKPDAQRVLKALRNGLGQMPSCQGKLSDEQMAAVAASVAQASGVAP